MRSHQLGSSRSLNGHLTTSAARPPCRPARRALTAAKKLRPAATRTPTPAAAESTRPEPSRIAAAIKSPEPATICKIDAHAHRVIRTECRFSFIASMASKGTCPYACRMRAGSQREADLVREDVDVRTVWVDHWQLQCCGTPFEVGAGVSWTVTTPDAHYMDVVLGHVLPSGVDYCEEHHGDPFKDEVGLTGRVAHIRAVFCAFAPASNGPRSALRPVAGSAVLQDRSSVDGSERALDDLRLIGYVVTIEDAA